MILNSSPDRKFGSGELNRRIHFMDL